MKKDIEIMKERQRIGGINIAKILEKQNETFAIIRKIQNDNKERETNLKILR